MSVRTLLRTLAVTAFALAATVAVAAPSSAHDRLTATDPADGSRVSSVPRAISLTYNEPVLAVGSRVQVVGPDGDVAAGRPQVTDNVVKVAIGDVAPAGKYTVTWRVTSSDGHPISGAFTFTARKPVGTPPGTPSPAPGGEAAATPSGAPAVASSSPIPSQNTGSTGDGLPGVAVIGIGALVLLLLMALTFLIGRMRGPARR